MEHESLVGKVVRIRWRDVWADNDQHSSAEWKDECLWDTYGLVVAETDDLIRITADISVEKDDPFPYRGVSHILKTLIVEVEVYA
jgi:hypothetical protein